MLRALLPFIALLSVLSFHTVQAATPSVSVIYENTGHSEDSTTQRRLKQEGDVQLIQQFIEEMFRLKQPLEFRFGDNEGPYFDPAKNLIAIPYAFIDEVEQRFSDADYQQTGVSAREATRDALLHTLLHEFAHAAIAMYDLPIVGKEEDAADGLATVLLIEFFEQGQEIALSAADLFNLESEDRDVLEEEDFWDEHSLDEQRYYQTLCHVYGSAPEQYADFLEKTSLTQERAEQCIAEYGNLTHGWMTLLKPHLKNL